MVCTYQNHDAMTLDKLWQRRKHHVKAKKLLHFALNNWKIHDDYIMYLSIVVRVSIIPKVFVVSKAQLDQS